MVGNARRGLIPDEKPISRLDNNDGRFTRSLRDSSEGTRLRRDEGVVCSHPSRREPHHFVGAASTPQGLPISRTQRLHNHMVNRRHGRTGSCDKGFSLGLAAGHSKRDRYTLEKEKTTRRAMLYSGPRKYRGRSTVTPTQLQPKRRDLSAAMADRRDRPSPAIPNHRTVLRKMVEGKVDRSLRAKIRTRSSRSHRRRPGGNTLPRRIGDPSKARPMARQRLLNPCYLPRS
ncbi:hypothetical protein ADUPG1_013606 [Aduncisulcus paluster]|uniref:Uncharacterized protein n=1 Tax=Aduncisulcus paluster TaxID=2918883 RepID=A0ABQ5K3K9_9EUKA|nr:hypothetical protein ADUPG1_013606 [Aduncisulcus paluster]